MSFNALSLAKIGLGFGVRAAATLGMMAGIVVSPENQAYPMYLGGSIKPRRTVPIVKRPVDDDEAFLLFML